MADVKATRMELLQTKQRLALAQKGYNILKQKRDALVLEFFNILKNARDLRSQVDAQMEKSRKSLAITKAYHGELFVEANAFKSRVVTGIKVKGKNVMGIKIPVVQADFSSVRLEAKGYSLRGTSAKFDQAVEDFEETARLLVKLSESETALKRLIAEIEKTNRRVNALDYIIQPRLKHTIKGISEKLERLEFENIFALKLVKRRMAAREAQ
jgi:V/A-type H+-transporting ATPase subunit D